MGLTSQMIIIRSQGTLKHGLFIIYKKIPEILVGNFRSVRTVRTLGARDFSSAVSGFCQVFIVTRAFVYHL